MRVFGTIVVLGACAIAAADSSSGRTVATDSQGNALVLGASATGAVLVKLSPAGVQLWSQEYPNIKPGVNLVVDSNGDAVFAHNSGVNFAKITKVRGSDGVAVWTRNSPRRDTQWLAIGPANTVHFASRFAAGSELAYVQKFASDGTALWARTVGDNAILRLSVDTAGSVFYTSHSSLVKLNANGAGLWRRTASDTEFGLLELDAAGNPLTVGTISTASDSDVRIRKHSSQGAPLWTRDFTRPGLQVVSRSAITPAGDLYISASDLVPSGPNQGLPANVVMLKINTANVPGWAVAFDRDPLDRTMAITADSTGVYTTIDSVTAQNTLRWRAVKFSAENGQILFEKVLSSSGKGAALSLDGKGGLVVNGTVISQGNQQRMVTVRLNAKLGGLYWVDAYQ